MNQARVRPVCSMPEPADRPPRRAGVCPGVTVQTPGRRRAH